MATAVVRGDGQYVDYTPSSAVSAGDVVVVGSLVGVAGRDIAADQKGALLVRGLVDFPKATGDGTQISAGAQVYWDADNSVVTTEAGGGANKKVGVAAEDAGNSDDTVRVLLGHHVA